MEINDKIVITKKSASDLIKNLQSYFEEWFNQQTGDPGPVEYSPPDDESERYGPDGELLPWEEE